MSTISLEHVRTYHQMPVCVHVGTDTDTLIPSALDVQLCSLTTKVVLKANLSRES